MVSPEIKQLRDRLSLILKQKGISIENIIIYKSHASGKSHSYSDIDIAVVSPDFGLDRFEEGKLLLQAAWRIDPRIQPVPVSSEAFEKDTCVPLIYETRERGIEIKAA